MKRLFVSLMVVAGALLSACTEEEQFLQTAGLAGSYDVALVDPGDVDPDDESPSLLFVTSTDNDELRVLSLEEEVTERRFIRAPNPLQPLAIPVLPRPQSLTRDVRYDENGMERSGRLVFARSSGSTEISVVSAERDVLREVRRLQTTRQPGAAVGPMGPVTAFAAQAPAQANGQTRLFFATQETNGARLWQALLPPRETLLAERGLEEARRTVVMVEAFPGFPLPENVAVNSLLVLPPFEAGHPGGLAVATRGAAGTVYRVDLRTGAAQQLNFGGAQVLQLATHGRVEYDVVVQTFKDPGGVAANNRRETQRRVQEAGSRIFGVLDPSNCGVRVPCIGVLAVDVATGLVARDRTALDENGNFVDTYEMMTLTSGVGLPMGLSIATNRNLQVQSAEPVDVLDPTPTNANRQRGLTLPILGIVPLSNGAILFFDALNLTHLNVDAFWANASERNQPTFTVSLINAQGVTLEANANEGSGGVDSAEVVFSGTFGVTRDQTYALTYQGLLPGMVSVPRADDDSFRVPAQPSLGQVVQPGDTITLLSAATGGQACATDVTVLSVQPTSDTQLTLVPSGALPADCAGFEFFQVRAGGTQPLVISSASEEYIERVGGGGEFSRTGPYFFHPPGYAGQTENVAARFKVERELLETSNPGRRFLALARGDRYVVSVDAHFFPYLISVDTASPTGDLTFFRLPGPVVQATVDNVDYAYIAYPSANGVLEVDMTNITAGIANSRGLFPYL